MMEAGRRHAQLPIEWPWPMNRMSITDEPVARHTLSVPNRVGTQLQAVTVDGIHCLPPERTVDSDRPVPPVRRASPCASNQSRALSAVPPKHCQRRAAPAKCPSAVQCTERLTVNYVSRQKFLSPS
ncbi:hypothetical protein VFPFJ_09595 [Purpureocillium lilacinum]|uniref:Uncharacterized protein n=1 Tax=Purpureocillium lilacinum TaxID=33203 RepID=A0A179GUZ5_PURLI|nr:hypothetical protein VFPFJ_09595 [Purpureocillium lilacinum]OAQ81140.1 hypothetical protein VFPFJ_09595 [Purpureocillium lilacinum]